MKTVPSESSTVTNYYKQDVYDPNQSKIGKIDDVLVDKSGKVTGLVIGVAGFLGASNFLRGKVVERSPERILVDVPGGPAIANGVIATTSGYGQWGGMRGNVLLVFSVDGK